MFSLNKTYLTAAIQFILNQYGACTLRYIRELLIIKNINATDCVIQECLNDSYYFDDCDDGTYCCRTFEKIIHPPNSSDTNGDKIIYEKNIKKRFIRNNVTIDEIINVLSDHPEGLKAWQIGEILNTDRKSINSLLYKNRHSFIRDENFFWTLRSKIVIEDDCYEQIDIEEEKEHWFLSKFQNRDKADYFTADDFYKLADWSYGGSPSFNPQKKYKAKSGNVIECDSNSEVKLLEYLDRRSGIIRDIGGQSLTINYSSFFRKNNNYSPDVVVLTNDGRIGIIEVKPTIAMSYHKNIEKYEALKEYCKKNGFMYMMVDPDSEYMTYDDLKRFPVSQDLINIFENIENYLEPEKTWLYHFTKKDVDKWYSEYGLGDKKSFNLEVYSMIIRKGWFNTFDKGFNVYNHPVKLDNNHNVIEYSIRTLYKSD